MSGQELGDYQEDALSPLSWYLLPQDIAIERVMNLQPSGIIKRMGIVLTEKEIGDIYSDYNLWLFDPIRQLFDQKSLFLFNQSEFSEPDIVLRDPGVIIAGSLIDFLTLLDTEKISRPNQIDLVRNSMNWLDLNCSPVHKGVNFHQSLGHFFGRAVVCGTYETDPFMNTQKAREFVSGYAAVCDKTEKEKFEKGYQIGVFRAMSDYDLLDVLPIRGDNIQVIGFDLN